MFPRDDMGYATFSLPDYSAIAFVGLGCFEEGASRALTRYRGTVHPGGSSAQIATSTYLPYCEQAVEQHLVGPRIRNQNKRHLLFVISCLRSSWGPSSTGKNRVGPCHANPCVVTRNTNHCIRHPPITQWLSL